MLLQPIEHAPDVGRREHQVTIADRDGVDFEILTFNLAGPVLAVRPYCHTDNYWQVYFDTNQANRAAFGEAGFPVPQKLLHIAQSS